MKNGSHAPFGLLSGEKKKGRNFLRAAIGSAILFAIVKAIWPNSAPYAFWDLWASSGSLGDWLWAAWPAFAWAAAVNVIAAVFSGAWTPRWLRPTAGDIAKEGFVVSLAAGVLEEISFRWLIFLWAIVTVQISDFLLGGFIFNHGLVWLVNEYIVCPLANWTTFGWMHHVLYHPWGWAVGAAVLSANAFFRDGHKYQGLIGVINSWFMGMFFFWMTFKYGLLSAIVVHFAYDMTVYGVHAAIAFVRHDGERD